MALINSQGPAFAHYTTNFGSTVNAGTGSGFGSAVNPGASNTDGTAVTVLSALAHDCEYLWLGIGGLTNIANATGALMDVLVDPAGGTSWSVLIEDLIVGGASFLNFVGSGVGIVQPLAYHFPLWIPAGASIGARIRAPAASPVTTGYVLAMAAGGNKNPAAWWCGQKVETIGTFDTANSVGQMHTPGASGATSSWTNLGSPSTGHAGAAQWGCGGSGGATPADIGPRTYRYDFGVAGTIIGPPVVLAATPAECAGRMISGLIFCDIPAGSQLQVRGNCSGSMGPAAGAPFDCGAYLVQ